MDFIFDSREGNIFSIFSNHTIRNALIDSREGNIWRKPLVGLVK